MTLIQADLLIKEAKALGIQELIDEAVENHARLKQIRDEKLLEGRRQEA